MALEPCRQRCLVALQGVCIADENAGLAPRSAALFDAGFARRQGARISTREGGGKRRFHPLYCSPGGSG